MGGAAPHGRWAEKQRRAGSPGKLDTLLWGGAARAEPGAGEREEGRGGRRVKERRKQWKRERREKKRKRERQERKLIKGCSPQIGKRLGEKMNRRLRQLNKQDTEGKGNLIICHFV